MYCKNCGREMDRDSAFCPVCGEEMRQHSHGGYDVVRTGGRRGFNGVSIVGFIFSFIMPLIGLILCIVGLNKAKRNGQRLWLAVLGIIISMMFLLAAATYIFNYYFPMFDFSGCVPYYYTPYYG